MEESDARVTIKKEVVESTLDSETLLLINSKRTFATIIYIKEELRAIDMFISKIKMILNNLMSNIR